MQTIVTLKLLFRRGDIANGLILCPKSVLGDWEKKLKDWAPEIRVEKVRGSKEQREITWKTPAHIYLTTYESLRQDLGNSLGISDSPDIAKKEFDIAILDEIQKIKNPGADVTKAARHLVAPRKWGLSGTPLENRTEELISIFAFLKPGLLIYDDAQQPLKVKAAIKPFFLRRRKADVLDDLPEKNCDEVWLELSDDQRRAYDRAEKEGVFSLNNQGDSVTVQHVLALITKLKQICNIEPVSGESCKLEYLIDQLEEIKGQDDKALIFSQYSNKTLNLLEPKLRQFRPRLYDGSLSDSNRDKIIDEFQNKDDCKILLMSVKAGGLGLTLTRANFVFHFDLWWNPAVAAQAEGRAHRIGQKKTVYVTSLFTINTIEEKIQTLLKRKKELFDRVIDDLSDTNLSVTLGEDELFGLFDLRKPKQKRYSN
ncbi:MAG: DEAD/DEAH box helicase [Candidatus Wolfebacteria bacterium]|nr:DEAD/DEAH box helicase [Candidatus Wolfebacteria bacterium]